jgi:hypothetical protein
MANGAAASNYNAQSNDNKNKDEFNGRLKSVKIQPSEENYHVDYKPSYGNEYRL